MACEMGVCRWLGAAIASALLVVAASGTAHAGGTEFPAAGTRALSRGGAFAARADGPMTLAYNPANLAGISGIQLSLQTNVAFYDACMDRNGTYTQYGEPAHHDEVSETELINPNFYAPSIFNRQFDGADRPLDYPNAEMPRGLQ